MRTIWFWVTTLVMLAVVMAVGGGSILAMLRIMTGQ
jgi:hypothetical protein